MSQLVRLEGKDITQSAHCALWGHRLPVTALALSARRLDNMGLEKGIGGLKAQNLPRSYRFIPSSWTFEVIMVSY